MKKALVLMIAALAGLQYVSADDNIFFKKTSGEIIMKPMSSHDKISFKEPEGGLFSFSKTKDVTASTDTTISDGFEVKINSEEIKTFATSDMEVGIVYSWYNNVPVYGYDATMKTGTEMKDYTFTVYGLDHGVKYYWRPYVRVFGSIYYGNSVDSITTSGEAQTLSRQIELVISNPFDNEGGWDPVFHYLHITLDRYNVGSCSDGNPGTYFAYGETMPKDEYTQENWKWKDYSGRRFTASDDAVSEASKGECRSLNIDDMMYLYIYSDNIRCTEATRTAPDGSQMKGVLLAGDCYGSIFIPASGYYDGSSIKYKNQIAFLWGMRLENENPNHESLVIPLNSQLYYESRDYYMGVPMKGVYGIYEEEF